MSCLGQKILNQAINLLRQEISSTVLGNFDQSNSISYTNSVKCCVLVEIGKAEKSKLMTDANIQPVLTLNRKKKTQTKIIVTCKDAEGNEVMEGDTSFFGR